MLALITAVFVASLIGSLHCAGMCGAFVAIAAGAEPRQRTICQAAYHGGRLITYTLLGAAAGAAGQLVNLGSTLAGLRPIAAALAGAAMVAFGILTLMRLMGWKAAVLHPPAFLAKLVQRGHLAAMGYSPVSRALVIGLLTTLLPCGWLYAFATTAAGTASAPMGALTMAVFWAGTLPILVAIGAGVQRLFGSLGRHVGAATAILLVCVGLYTLSGRMLMDPAALAAKVHPAATSSGPAAPQVPPCCTGHDNAK